MLFIDRMHVNLVITTIGVHPAQQFMPNHVVDQLIYSREREAILRAGFVQVAEVDARFSLHIGLYYQDRVRDPS